MKRENGIVERAIKSLGKGFDITSDFRLKFCKGNHRLVLLNEDQKRELFVPGFGVHQNVSIDIKYDKGDQSRLQSLILDFNQMSEYMNRKCGVGGKIPTGEFNGMFRYENGCWGNDAANTKCLGLHGSSVELFSVHLDRYPLRLLDEVHNAVPSAWDPLALSRFIEKYGTHIIVGISVGGQDMLLLKQDKSSDLDSSELKTHFGELANQVFTGTCTCTPGHSKTREHRQKAAPFAFNIFDPASVLSDCSSLAASKDGITVISAKRGGDPSINSHCEWLLTVPSMPDAIQFSFIPITSLLKGVPGKGFLSHAINLYLRHKPPISDLEYFLDFQYHKVWAPIHSELPLAPTTNMPVPTSTLQFNMMGPKLHVNTTLVTTDKKPVLGMQLYLEGMRCNRLAIHLQHLSSMPAMFQNKVEELQFWQGSKEIADERYWEPIQKKKFSHICTARVKYDPAWVSEHRNAAFIVTGTQLHVEKHGSKQVLHIRLLFSKVAGFEVVRSEWGQSSSGLSQKLRFLTGTSTALSGTIEREEQNQRVVVDSSQFPDGPPVPVQRQRLLQFVDAAQVCRGPHDSPGYWAVTGAKLNLEKKKICLHVKFSLLNLCS